MAKVIVRMSRRHNLFENLVWFFRPGNFSHAAIALEEDPKTFYTFNLKGFHIEGTKRKTDTTTVYYELIVTDEEYATIKNRIEEVRENRDSYKYAAVGVFLALIYIPLKMKNHYFCSQFVASVLMDAGVVSTTQPAATTLPNDLNALLVNLTGAEKEPPSGAKDIVMTAVQQTGGAILAILIGDDENIPDIGALTMTPIRRLVNRINIMVYLFRFRRRVMRIIRDVVITAIVDNSVTSAVRTALREARRLGVRGVGESWMKMYAENDLRALRPFLWSTEEMRNIGEGWKPIEEVRAAEAARAAAEAAREAEAVETAVWEAETAVTAVCTTAETPVDTTAGTAAEES